MFHKIHVLKLYVLMLAYNTLGTVLNISFWSLWWNIVLLCCVARSEFTLFSLVRDAQSIKNFLVPPMAVCVEVIASSTFFENIRFLVSQTAYFFINQLWFLEELFHRFIKLWNFRGNVFFTLSAELYNLKYEIRWSLKVNFVAILFFKAS
jgi:hypothetical protein